MVPQSVIIHERLANWARKIRPRFRGDSIRWSETRSSASLVEAVGRSSCPILLLDLGERPALGLVDLDAALLAAPTALSLVFEPQGRPEVVSLAREIGATLVLSGVVVPPEVEATIHRWLPLARQRAEAEGWSPLREPEPEPWERPDLLLAENHHHLR